MWLRLKPTITTNIKSAIILVAAGIILLRQLVPLTQLIRNFPLNDLSVYLDGTKASLRGDNPYKMWFFDRYNYPPAATVLFVPFTHLQVDSAEYIFTVISLVSLWATITIILASMIVKMSWPSRLLVFALVLKTFPVKLTLVLGQINLIILWLIVQSFFTTNRRLAGALLGIATAIKITPAPLVALHFW